MLQWTTKVDNVRMRDNVLSPSLKKAKKFFLKLLLFIIFCYTLKFLNLF